MTPVFVLTMDYMNHVPPSTAIVKAVAVHLFFRGAVRWIMIEATTEPPDLLVSDISTPKKAECRVLEGVMRQVTHNLIATFRNNGGVYPQVPEKIYNLK